MDKAYLSKKIKLLSDEKLIELLKLKNNGNKEIIELVEVGANKRNIDIPSIDSLQTSQHKKQSKNNRGENTLDLTNILAEILSVFK